MTTRAALLGGVSRGPIYTLLGEMTERRRMLDAYLRFLEGDQATAIAPHWRGTPTTDLGAAQLEEAAIEAAKMVMEK